MPTAASDHAPIRGACGHDCPDTCAWTVEVQNGTATRLAGDPAHPFTRGTLCAKVNHYLERVYHPDRVLHPLKRTGRKGEGQFTPVSWAEALADIAARWQAIIDRVGRRSHPALQLRRRAGRDPAGIARSAALRIDGLHRAAARHLRRRGLGRHAHDDRRRLRDRSRGHRPQPLHRAVGHEHHRHQPALLAVCPRSAAARRPRGRGGSGAHADGRRGRLAPADRAGRRRGAGAGDDACHGARRPGRSRLRRSPCRRLRCAGRARERLLARGDGGHRRTAGRRHRALRAGVRHHPAVAHPAAHRPRAPPQRRDAVPHGRVPAGAERGVAASRRRPGAIDPRDLGSACSTWTAWSGPTWRSRTCAR